MLTRMRSVRSSLLGAVVALSVASSPVQADEARAGLGAALVVASETESGHSAAHGGPALLATLWNGRIGAALELGRHGWTYGGTVTWLRGSMRIGWFEAPRLVCPQTRSTCVGIRPWFDAGIARESWNIPHPDGFAPQLRAERWSRHAGVGIDTELARFTFTFFLRVQHVPGTEPAADPYGPNPYPYRTNLLFGVGALL